jgi:5-methylcytosine-specific restriction endonuclease McrA
MDHVKPAHLYSSRSEATYWENITTACFACNQRKGGMLPYQCGMYPHKTPRTPHYVQMLFAGRGLNHIQKAYIREWFKIKEDDNVLL